MLHVAMLAPILLASGVRAEEPKKPIEGKPLPDKPKPIAERVLLEYLPDPGAREACPSERALRHAILSNMEVNPFSSLARAKLRVRIVSAGGMFQARYEIFDSDGKLVFPRVLTTQDDCGLAVADLAFSVGRFLPLFVTAPVPGTCQEAAPVCEEPPPSKPPPPPATRSFSVRVDAALLGSFESSPGKFGAPGFWVHLGLQWQFFSLSGGVRHEFPTSLESDPFKLSISRTLGEVVPCLRGKIGLSDPFAIGFACGLLQVGALEGTVQVRHGFGTENTLTVVAGVRAGFEIPAPVFFSSLNRSPIFSHLAFFLAIDVDGTVLHSGIGVTNMTNEGVLLSLWKTRPFPTGVALGATLPL